MALGLLKRQDFRVSTGELYAIQSVYAEVASGELKVGGLITRHWYKHMAGVISKGIEATLADNPLDETVVNSEIILPLNKASGTMLQRSIDTAIGHYSGADLEKSVASFNEDINVLRGLSSALATRV